MSPNIGENLFILMVFTNFGKLVILYEKKPSYIIIYTTNVNPLQSHSGQSTCFFLQIFDLFCRKVDIPIISIIGTIITSSFYYRCNVLKSELYFIYINNYKNDKTKKRPTFYK